MSQTIFDMFRSLDTCPITQSAIDILEQGKVGNEAPKFTRELIATMLPKAPSGQRISRHSFWYRMAYEKCAWKGLYIETRRESAEKWMSEQARHYGENWPPKPVFEKAVYMPQPNPMK